MKNIPFGADISLLTPVDARYRNNQNTLLRFIPTVFLSAELMQEPQGQLKRDPAGNTLLFMEQGEKVI